MSFLYQGRQLKTLSEVDVKGKRVFCRVDFNVPLKDGVIQDDSRIRAALPTLRYLLDQGASLVLASHLGRPKGKPESKYSLLPVAQHLAELLHHEVLFPDDCVGSGVKKLLIDVPAPFVVLLENLRFHAEEEANDAAFSEGLVHGCQVYVNDAFGAIHRAHASVAGLAKHFDQKCMGYLVEKEVAALGPLMEKPQRPYAVVMGGAKISDKLKVVEHVMKKADRVLIGGAMAFTFLKSMGRTVGNSLIENDWVGRAGRLLSDAAERGVQVYLPLDFQVAPSIEQTSQHQLYDGQNIPAGLMGLDIGPRTIASFEHALEGARTVFWNGPMGLFETTPFDVGTKSVALAISRLKAYTVIGGGDSVSAAVQAGVEKQFTHCSTGGGASLEFLEGKALPGLLALG